MRFGKLAFFLAVGLVWGGGADLRNARWVIVSGGDGTQNTAAPPGLEKQWGNVGQIGDGSGIYLGNGWVLTARHVGNGGISLPGKSFIPSIPESIVRLRDPATEAFSDIQLFKLQTDPELPWLDLNLYSPPAVGTAVTMMGYGRGRGTNEIFYKVTQNAPDDWTWTPVATAAAADISGYATVGGNFKRWGRNTTVSMSDTAVEPTIKIDAGLGPVVLFGTRLTDYGQGQAINGDSGGGVFDSTTGELIGMMDLISQYPDQPAGTVLFGQESYFLDLSVYMMQIRYLTGRNPGVPEPGGMVFALGAMGVLGLRRR